ncbi:MAG TPA: SusD/RagB family nutrient-binding outer membrane lipoprotein [Chitinophagaceae bacterium]|nr:SusD/RagB family nutrient-binding outer membrane lipoprotein [Chitinophagaceae bacterium]
MKKIIIYLCLVILLAGLNSCDKNFEKVNTNPVLATTLDPGYLFSNAQFSSAINTITYQNEIVQQIITPFTGVLEGGNHNVVYDPNSNALFNTMFAAPNGPVVLLTTVINQTKDNPARSNLYNMTRIWKAYVFEVLVDTYGDVPYSEAGFGFIEGTTLPKYEDDDVIYDDLLKELDEATKGLDASKPVEAGDLFYKGNIDQWKKLGNSLLLRVAMRYTKADAAKAQQFVTTAVSGGVMQSIADNAFIAFNSTFNHPTANSYQGTERGNYYLAKPFVDYLQSTNDPRLGVIAVKYEFPANPLATAGVEDTNPAGQQGMPLGYNESTISSDPLFPGKSGAAWKYSQLNRRTVAKIDVPEFFVTYAQTELLLAEAAQRGWIPGSPQTYYDAGVKAHMDQMTQYDVSATIPAAAQDAYLAANPFNPTMALEQINTQYWIASFQNGSEAWANLRRSGFPALAPNPYPGADPAVAGDFIHRLVYPVREKSVNTANYDEAVARVGGDNLSSRVFWDK